MLSPKRLDDRTVLMTEASRVVVKCGTSIVSTSQGLPALSRIAAIVEQCSELIHRGKEVILVSSGAIGCGKKKLQMQKLLSASMRTVLHQQDFDAATMKTSEDIQRAQRQHQAACAAAFVARSCAAPPSCRCTPRRSARTRPGHR